VPTCPECGRKTGWLSDIHPDCERMRRQREAALAPIEFDPVQAINEGRWVAVEFPPGMHTLNGFGTRLVGESNHHPESGTFETTLYFVILFLPIMPMSRYRVRRGPGRSYFFLEEGPLTHADWVRPLWWCGIAAAVIWVSTLF
jgi:hypothetical protein